MKIKIPSSESLTLWVEKLQTAELKPMVVAIALGFLCASALSVTIAWFFFPQLPKGNMTQSVGFESAWDSDASLSGEAIEAILRRNIFNSDGKLGDEAGEFVNSDDPETATKDLVVTDMPIKIVGIIYGGTPMTGLATIEKDQPKKSTNSYVVGDLILDAKVVEILRDRVIFERGSRREYAVMEDFRLMRSQRKRRTSLKKAPLGIAPIATGPPPDSYKEEGFERDGTSIELTSEYKNRLIGDELTKTLQDAKAEPNIDPETGQLRGFVMTKIRENSIFQKAGLQNGDIVEEINGVPLNSIAGAMGLLNGLRNENSVEMRVNRGGSTTNFSISVN